MVNQEPTRTKGGAMSDGDDGDIRYHDVDEGDRETEDALREDGPGGRSVFDPTPYMRQLRGRGGGPGQEYLDVKWRLLWLRREHPDAEIITEHVRIDDASAIFKATVIIPSGGKATGYGSETAGDFGDFIEKAETKAIGRALNALGYGAQFAEGDEDAPPAPPARGTVPSPRSAGVAPPPPSPRATPVPSAPKRSAVPDQSVPVPSSAAPIEPAPTERVDLGTAAPTERIGPSPGSRGSSPPINFVASRDRGAAPSGAGAGGRSTVTATRGQSRSSATGTPGADQEPELEDYSWTAFWGWARPLGYSNKREIESFLGRPLGNLSPAEVRTLVRKARGEG